MENYQKIVLIFGLVATAALLFFDTFFAGIALVLVAALFISFLMMNLSKRFADLPEVYCVLRDDAKAVIVKNKGETTAKEIHVALVPLDIEFDIPSLDPQATFEFLLASMINEGKAVITFRDMKDNAYSHTSPLSALGGGEEEILKPVFPMFGWK